MQIKKVKYESNIPQHNTQLKTEKPQHPKHNTSIILSKLSIISTYKDMDR